eukprot:2522273-Amphidinium_carterae.1
MPAPRADAQQVPIPMEQESHNVTSEQQLQVTGGHTAAAGSSGANEALPHTIIVPGQARARGDEEIDDPHPGSVLQSWCATALASLGRRRKRVQEQQEQEHVTRVTGSEERDLDRRSTRDSEERGSMTSGHASQFDATGTSHSNKISSQAEPSGKRVRIALSPTRRVIHDDAPDDQVPVPGPVPSQVTETAPVAVSEVTPPPPNPSPHDQTPSHASHGRMSDRDESQWYNCPLCNWRFYNANRRYLHLGLQHSVLLPKIGGETQDNLDGSKLYMIPVLSTIRGHNGTTQWASRKIMHAYQTVVRNALLVPKHEWARISNRRWGSRDDERFVPPKNTPPSHMDMPEQEQLAMFEGENAIRLLATGEVIYHDIPASNRATDRSQSYDRSHDRSHDSYRDWKAESWTTDTFRAGEWQNTHHGRWDRDWGSNSWDRESDSHRRSQSQSQFHRSWHQDDEQAQRRSHSTTGHSNRPKEPVPPKNEDIVAEGAVPSAGQSEQAVIDTDVVLGMQNQSQPPAQSNAQVSNEPPPDSVPTPVPQSQSAIIADVFDKHFKQIEAMNEQYVESKLIELHGTLDIDVFYKVAAIFDKEPGDFPPHRQAMDVEEGHVIVQVQNKMSEPDTGTGSASSGDRPRMKPPPQQKTDSVTSPITEVPKHKGATGFVTSTPEVVTPAAKKPPPQMPKAEVKPPTGPPPPPVKTQAVRLQVPEENQQAIPVTPVTAPENAEEVEDVVMTTPQISVRGPQTSMLQAHTLSAVTEGSPPPAKAIVENIQTSQVGLVPSSIANLDIIPPDVSQYEKAPRSWPVTEVTGPEFPGTSVTTALDQSEWNMTQCPDLPLQAARVQGTIMQQLMNLATNQNARMEALEQLVTNQYNILISSPGSQLMGGTIPALIRSSMETKATLERLSKEFNEREDLKNRQPYSAVEAFENLSAQQEALQKHHREMVRSISSMAEKVKELQQNQQLLQKSNADLTRTSQYLREAVKSHETSMLHVQAELKRVTDRSEKMLVNRAEHDRAGHKKEIEEIHKTFKNLFSVIARLDVNTEDIVTREVARDERTIGLITDMNNSMTNAESSMFGLTPVVRALFEHNLPDVVRQMRPLAPVDHDYWGLIVPVEGVPTLRQVAQALVPPQYPEGGVAVAFAVPNDQAVPAVAPVTDVPAEETTGTGDAQPEA